MYTKMRRSVRTGFFHGSNVASSPRKTLLSPRRRLSSKERPLGRPWSLRSGSTRYSGPMTTSLTDAGLAEACVAGGRWAQPRARAAHRARQQAGADHDEGARRGRVECMGNIMGPGQRA